MSSRNRNCRHVARCGISPSAEPNYTHQRSENPRRRFNFEPTKIPPLRSLPTIDHRRSFAYPSRSIPPLIHPLFSREKARFRVKFVQLGGGNFEQQIKDIYVSQIGRNASRISIRSRRYRWVQVSCIGKKTWVGVGWKTRGRLDSIVMQLRLRSLIFTRIYEGDKR